MDLTMKLDFDKLPPKLRYMMDHSIFNEDWATRPIITDGKYKVPAYFEMVKDESGNWVREYYKEPIFSVVYKDILTNIDKYRGKRIVDMGSGSGLGVIMLKDAGLDVIGVERDRTNYIGGVYTMMLNDIYYDLVYSDQRYLKKIDYDVVIFNGTFRIWEFVETLVPVMRVESLRGKEVLFWTGKDPDKLMNFEKYKPADAGPNDPPLELF